jgi:5-methyltetrahydropteroyltriglutamate--homocysteine methyltransferase
MKGNKIVDPVTVGVVSHLKKQHDISVDEFSFLRGITKHQTKITVPSPTMMSYYFAPGISNKIYPDPNDFLDQVTEILKEGVQELENQGVNYLQVDAPEFGMLLDPFQQEWFRSKGFDPNELIRSGVKRINHMLSEFSGTTALHICRGNDKNRFMARGGYDRFAEEIFQSVYVDRLLLEYDTDRAGDFSPLRFVPKNKTVVLGLITTKSPILEDEGVIMHRIEEATTHIPIENLALSTQCGFASVAKGNNLSFRDQKKKLQFVVKLSHKVWNGK